MYQPQPLTQLHNHQKRESRARDDTARASRHEPNGFPHLSSSSGRCMCYDRCCFGPAGCKCKQCPCGGKGHG